MHKVVVPKRSSIHRFACLALYRALLRQCSASPSHAPWHAETTSLVKQRFRKYQRLQSPSQVVNALNAGYRILDLLDSASKGNQKDSHQLSTILAQAKAAREERAALRKQKAEANPPKPLSPKQARKEESIRFQKETSIPHPDRKSIFARPQPVSGRRRVPVLVNARGIPFLRIKKPQPRNLSGFLRAKLEKRWHCIEVRDRLQSELLFAKDEDTWDRLTNAVEPCKWTDDIQQSLEMIFAKIANIDRTNKEMAERMWQVVLRERELAAKEESQRQQESIHSPLQNPGAH